MGHGRAAAGRWGARVRGRGLGGVVEKASAAAAALVGQSRPGISVLVRTCWSSGYSEPARHCFICDAAQGLAHATKQHCSAAYAARSREMLRAHHCLWLSMQVHISLNHLVRGRLVRCREHVCALHVDRGTRQLSTSMECYGSMLILLWK